MGLLRLAFVGLLAAFLSACGRNETDDGRPLVVATTTMAADLVREVAGDRVKLRALMGPEVDPHNYVPALPDTSLIERADLVVYCGLHLEGRLQDSLEELGKRGREVVSLAAGIPTDRLLSPQEQFEGAKDPHVWGDPTLWKETIPGLVAALSKIDPEGAPDYETNGKAYAEELETLHAWAKERVAEVAEEKRVLVTSHDAFFYFGRAYGFEVRGLQGVSTAAEAGLKDRADLVAYIRERGIRTLFAETSVNEKGIRAVAREAGASISSEPLFSDAMGKAGDVVEMRGETYDRGTYVGMIKHNINTIVGGLK